MHNQIRLILKGGIITINSQNGCKSLKGKPSNIIIINCNNINELDEYGYKCEYKCEYFDNMRVIRLIVQVAKILSYLLQDCYGEQGI